ncbi:type 1 glutamine amidotransferase [Pedobacter sp. BS3]|uniref:type 1 glutamine amidotransferase domain-containing protein n=1 Tax=Pedobacter sp. BS3 TaxID=2567937 RepID=UPI0011EC0557|nr:type 1 glutamine amidotransferase domain-containing protein [Pedobacter sp. BS3]TZF83028.1 type 1 glutamine amidotransferase [Pedobacter sp. BS3]
MEKLSGKKIAILSENGFEEDELTSPKEALEQAGATVQVVSPQRDKIRAMKNHNWSVEVPVDRHISEVSASEYDGLMLPGGVMNPDQLRLNEDAVRFVREFFESGKPVAAICHGPQTLITADVLHGRRVTSYPSIKPDLINAGATWTDEEVVTDHGLVTSRTPADLPAFNRKMCEEFAEGVHAEQHA